MSEPLSHKARTVVSTNTYMSVGLAALIGGGIWSILTAISGTKTEIKDARLEILQRVDKVESRVSNLESTRNIWTTTAMYKWAIHLQQANSDPKKLQTDGLKVPEPEIIEK